MTIVDCAALWQVDLAAIPPNANPATGSPVWELLICTATGDRLLRQAIPQALINGDWVTQRLQDAVAAYGLPQGIQIFRPSAQGLVGIAAAAIATPLLPTRHTPALKAWLRELSPPGVDRSQVEQLPPQPLPATVQGDRWQFGAVLAQDVVELFRDRPIPIVLAPEERWPLTLGLAPDLPIPGLWIQGGRRAMLLARWLGQRELDGISYQSGELDGLILTAGLEERWVLATFTDLDVAIAGRRFMERRHAAQGLHLLVVHPDTAGMTTSGVWLLQSEADPKPQMAFSRTYTQT